MDGKTAVQTKRGVTPLNAWAFSFACMIGWGAFVMPATFFLKQGGMRGTLLAFAAAVPAMIAVAMNYHYLANTTNETASFFTLLESATNKELAFSASWALSFAYLCGIPMNARALANLTRTLLEAAFHIEFSVTVIDGEHLLVDMILMIVAFFVFGWLNIRGIRRTGVVQTTLALILFVGVTALAVMSLFYKLPTYQGNEIPAVAPGKNPTASFMAIFVMTPWAYFGFESVPMYSRELSFPKKRIGLIMILAVLAGTFIYLACIFVTLCGIPEGVANWPDYLDHLGSQHGFRSFPVLDAANRMFGLPGLLLALAAAVSAILTGLIGFTAVASRLFRSMAEKRVLFPNLAALHPKTHTPANAVKFLIFTSIAISIMATSFTIMEEIASACTACAYGFCSLAALVRAQRENKLRYVISGAVGLFVCLFWIAFLVVPVHGLNVTIKGKSVICLAVWVFFGIGAYTYSRVSPELIEKGGEKNAQKR